MHQNKMLRREVTSYQYTKFNYRLGQEKAALATRIILCSIFRTSGRRKEGETPFGRPQGTRGNRCSKRKILMRAPMPLNNRRTPALHLLGTSKTPIPNPFLPNQLRSRGAKSSLAF